MRLAPESVTSGRLALPVAEPEAERERVAVETVELTPAEGLMEAEADAVVAALVIMLDLALSMALLMAAEADEALTLENADEPGLQTAGTVRADG